MRPEGDIARSEVATIFFRLLTDEAREAYWSQTNPYSDVASGDWYNNAISTLISMGILDGYRRHLPPYRIPSHGLSLPKLQ